MGLVQDLLKRESLTALFYEEGPGFVTGQQLATEIKTLSLEFAQLPTPSVLGIVCDLSVSTLAKILAALEASHIVVLLPENTSSVEK